MTLFTAKVPMIAFACLVVEPQDTFAIYDIGEPVLERVIRSGKGFRYSPENQLGEGAFRVNNSSPEKLHSLHVVNYANTRPLLSMATTRAGSFCPRRHTQYLPSTFLKLSHLAPPQRPADVYEVCRDDDGRTRPLRRRVGQHHPRRRNPYRLSAKNLTRKLRGCERTAAMLSAAHPKTVYSSASKSNFGALPPHRLHAFNQPLTRLPWHHRGTGVDYGTRNQAVEISREAI